MKKKITVQFSKEERTKIVLDYLQSDLSYVEIAKKYGIKNSDKIRVWCSRYRKAAKWNGLSESGLDKTKESNGQNTKSCKDGEMTNGNLRKELWFLELENKALNILIDLAEETGIDLKKKIWVQAVDVLCENEGLDVVTACKVFGKTKLAWERAKQGNL